MQIVDDEGMVMAVPVGIGEVRVVRRQIVMAVD